MDNNNNINGYDMSYANAAVCGAGASSNTLGGENYLFPPKAKIEFSKREKIFAGISAVLGYLSVRLVFVPAGEKNALGLGAALTLLLICAYCAAFTKKHSAAHIIRIIIAAAFSANIFLTANFLIQILSGIFAALVLLYDRVSVSEKFSSLVRPQFISDIAQALFCPLYKMFGLTGAYKAEKGFAGQCKNIIIGILIALPSTILASSLLSSADGRFGAIMGYIFDNGLTNVIKFVFHMLIGLPAALYIFSSSWNSAHNEFEKAEKMQISEGFLTPIIGFVSVIPMCVIYLIFFFSQLSYYMSAFENLLPESAVSYSEYARSGFFELCGVAVINLAVIISVNLFCKRNGEKTDIKIRVISIILSVMTIALIVTAVRKMMLYISVYGLTRLRFYTSWFMILLALVFIGMIVNFVRKINLPRVIVYTFTIMFAVLAFGNCDSIIADYNISGYLNGEYSEIDVRMISELSSDCVPTVRKYSEKIDIDISSFCNNSGFDTITLSEIVAEKLYETE